MYDNKYKIVPTENNDYDLYLLALGHKYFLGTFPSEEAARDYFIASYR